MSKSATTIPNPKGTTAQPNTLKTNVKYGLNTKSRALARFGIIISLIINFKPSAKGCSKPQGPTTLGPKRR